MKLRSFVPVTLAAVLSFRIVAAFAPPSARARPASTGLRVRVEEREIVGEIKPVNNFVLVRVAEAVDRTEAGILLSDSAKLVKTEGRVVSVGPGRTDSETGEYCPIPLEPGDGVVYGKYDGTELDIDGKKHTLIRDTDVLVKFKGDSLTLEGVQTISDKVLVHVETKERETEGGLLLASTKNSQTRPSTGTVQRVGPGKTASNGQLSPMTVKEGDTIKFRDFAGSEVTIGGEEYSVVRMPDVLARF